MLLKQRIKIVIESKLAENLILGLIIINGITLGLETSKVITEDQRLGLRYVDSAILCIFVGEISAKIVCQNISFFKNGWNIFDFLIVGLALFPSSGSLSILRALRILRVLRLLSIIPQMRVITLALIKAIPGMLSILGLILLIFYISAVIATNLYGEDFEDWFGTIGKSMFSLFQIMTLESWSMGIARPVMEIYPYSWAFFVPFILVTSFAVINLLIGVIVNSMGSVSKETDLHNSFETSSIETKLNLINRDLVYIREMLKRLENLK